MKICGADPNCRSTSLLPCSCGSSVEKKKSPSIAGVRSTNAKSATPRIAQTATATHWEVVRKRRGVPANRLFSVVVSSFFLEHTEVALAPCAHRDESRGL
jgi:hypothetical protein